jgi:hypothetical protein
MTYQFLAAPRNQIWSQGLSAGERAILSLVEYGAAEAVDGCLIAQWTDFGLKMNNDKTENSN